MRLGCGRFDFDYWDGRHFQFDLAFVFVFFPKSVRDLHGTVWGVEGEVEEEGLMVIFFDKIDTVLGQVIYDESVTSY